MTMVRPCRLITRQRSHMGLTEGLTFMDQKVDARVAIRLAARVVMVPGPLSPVRILGPVSRDRDGVLEMGCERAVRGRDRPLVVVDVHLRAADRDHRLDRDRHALLELRARVGGDEVRHLRVLVLWNARHRGRRGSGSRENPARLDDGLDGASRCRRSILPRRACSMPAARAAWQTSSSRCASAEIVADPERRRPSRRPAPRR